MRADPPAPAGTALADGAWRRFAACLVATAAALLLGYLALALAVDPYDTGRPRLLHRDGVRPQGPRTAAASRGRDPAFTAAVIGNSHIQLVSPERLRNATGIPVVQLAVPGTGPGEQLLLAGYFLRHHPEARALVIGTDSTWCTGDPALPPLRPFPAWLLAEDWASYLRGLLRLGSAAEVAGRLAWAARPAPRRAAPDGYWDYEADYRRLGDPDAPDRAAALARPAPSEPDPGEGGPEFPAAARLRDLAESLAPGTALVLVFPPVYAAARARPGTLRAAAAEACRAALTAAVAPRGRVVDWSGDRPELHDPALFFDATHYRQPLARRLEADIAAALGARGPDADGPRP
ncbi:hypothetical protein VQ02_09840 [Methylobacterium variabile]|jgi:hypothetical protein|uniref:DUF1574 domain-containing protein n=1 Tax=Methylobacterium variabile TaxID=298794 RepID=A0A0J6SVX5_9HYPH|nr:hypothetical protein [Methylobacterium variabile]KMO39430.1 hypothetical protein VQ02_09840 [Methylobacterium variabile]